MRDFKPLELKQEGYSEPVLHQSVQVAQGIARQIVRYAAGDNYRKLSARLRYRPTKGDAFWYPTPPAYIEAIEPH